MRGSDRFSSQMKWYRENAVWDARSLPPNLPPQGGAAKNTSGLSALEFSFQNLSKLLLLSVQDAC